MALIKPFNGKTPQIHPKVAFIAENAVIIGDVTIEKGASIWYGCVLRGDVAPIVIGAYSNIQDNSVIHVASQALNGEAKGTIVGAYCTVGHMALLHACTLEDESFVGMQSCVMDGVLVPSHTMIGAGSLVSGHQALKAGGLYLGRPAKYKRPLSEQERVFMKASALHYVELGEKHHCS
jgi:carbonic anhydrase/acetyltransferase-like protein (isoleucine patch superfamily)